MVFYRTRWTTKVCGNVLDARYESGQHFFLTELRILIRVLGRIRIMSKNPDPIQHLSKLVAVEKLWYHI